MPDNAKAPHAVIRYNVRTYQSGGVVAVMAGRVSADLTISELEKSQTSDDRQTGWRYFAEKSDLKVGMDPREATQLRQARLEVRESEAPATRFDQPTTTRPSQLGVRP